MNRKVIKNASWIIVCKIAQSVISLIIGMISARYLGPSNYGLISYAGSITAFVMPIMQLGLGKTLVQEFIERPDKEGKILGTALVMNIISSFVCIGGIYVFLRIANAEESLTILVGVLFSICLIFQATEMIQYWFQAKLLSKYPSIASLVAYTLVALYKVYLLVSGKSVIWFAVSSTFDYLLISVILLVIYYKVGTQRLGFSGELVGVLLQRSKHYIVSTMMVTIFAQTDKIMLKLMLNETQTGYYSAAVNCISYTAFVYVAIVDSMRPPILEARHDGDIKAFENRLVQLYSIITYLSLLQSVVMVLFADPIIYVLYGSDYAAAAPVLRIAVWYVTFSYYGMIRNIWILAEEKQKYLWIINLSGAIANVALNAILIPLMGTLGAALASLITQIFTNVIIGYIIRPIRYNNRLMIKGLNVKLLISYIKTFFLRVSKKSD